ncbi:hypothetical protein [Longimicrobium sp.]|uniref:hypothetical protein n=1 Tax=Longimicrobium sp. TaxID=2029185 RepID=UPI002D002E9E|nr:hypothetical protein [Longimicrobium sp.]HSU16885.1 hypothetical protein [Longimicrobium sp.]
MPDEPNLPEPNAADAKEAVALARTQLLDVRTALARVTGGAPAGLVLAELAQQMAGDLAAYFDDLPMHRFTGRVARFPGVFGAVMPGRRIAHRVVLARYLSASPPMRGGPGFVLRWAEFGLVALGSDGVLRAGRRRELVRLPEDTSIPDDPLSWDDLLIRRVPSRAVRLARWPNAAVRVASPAQVLDALAAIAASLASTSRRDLELLQRLLSPG